MTPFRYMIWAAVVIYVTTMINLDGVSHESNTGSRSWSSGGGSGWSSGGGHK